MPRGKFAYCRSKEELSRMMKMPQQKATMRWQLGEKP